MDEYHPVTEPSVGRKRRERKERSGLSDRVRRQILRMLAEFDRCVYCNCTLNLMNATRDHIKPRSHGGTLHQDNIVLACRQCNNRKGNSYWPIRFGPRAYLAPGVPKPQRGESLLWGYIVKVSAPRKECQRCGGRMRRYQRRHCGKCLRWFNDAFDARTEREREWDESLIDFGGES